MKEEKSNLINIINKSNISEQELKQLLKIHEEPHTEKKSINITISNKHFKYGYFSDAHIGHQKFKEDLFLKAVKLFSKENVEFIIQSGDILEGMSQRDGSIYELSHLGFSQQMKYAEELFKMFRQPIYGIDGNHDAWYKKKANGGIIVGQELEKRVNNYTHLGEMEGDLIIKNINIKLFHANDGTAYAHSYKLQKLIESFSGGEKPNIVHSGHYHKALFCFLRNIFGFESGTLMGQSEWQRGKKIQAHLGFGIVDVYINKKGIERLTHTFVAGYE